jgi:SH3 domain protein
MSILKNLILFAVLMIGVGISAAETRYVTDDFEVMLRTGPSIQNKIIRPLRSGTRIEVLREDSGNGHSQVQTVDGEIGYILRRFISEQPSARNEVARLRTQLDELRSDPSELQTLLADAQEQNQQLIALNVELTDANQQIKSELKEIKEVSGDVVQIAAQNRKLESEVQELLLQLDDIRIQNEALKDNSETIRNLIGAGLVFFGLLLGWILSISGRRNRNSWGS